MIREIDVREGIYGTCIVTKTTQPLYTTPYSMARLQHIGGEILTGNKEPKVSLRGVVGSGAKIRMPCITRKVSASLRESESCFADAHPGELVLYLSPACQSRVQVAEIDLVCEAV